MSLHCAKSYLLCAGLVELNALMMTFNAMPVSDFIHPSADFLGFSLLFQLCLASAWLSGRTLRPLPTPRPTYATTLRGSAISVLTLAAYGTLVLSLKTHLPGSVDHHQPATLVVISLLATLPALWLTLKTHRTAADASRKESLLYDRIRCHFLFNSLNTTAGLISDSPKTAEDNLVALAHLFRNLMKQGTMITLKDEIETAEKYLEVERNRLGDRLAVEWTVPDPSVLLATIPSMMLQPLIENAVYHGVESCPDGGTIHIRITADRRFLFFEIRNPIGNAPKFVDGTDSATKTIHAQLKSSFGIKHEFFFKKTRGEYLVYLKLPRKEEL